ncbi:MAG: hypothetical protein ABL998_16620, partial [Planctomycetota bacterium]
VELQQRRREDPELDVSPLGLEARLEKIPADKGWVGVQLADERLEVRVEALDAQANLVCVPAHARQRARAGGKRR